MNRRASQPNTNRLPNAAVFGAPDRLTQQGPRLGGCALPRGAIALWFPVRDMPSPPIPHDACAPINGVIRFAKGSLVLARIFHIRDSHPGIRQIITVCAALAIVAAPLTTDAAHGPDVLASDALFRFVVMNDAHITAEDLERSSAQLAAAVDEINLFANELDFVLIAGDMAQSGDPFELDLELAEVLRMLLVHLRDEFVWADSETLRMEHDGSAMRVVRTDVQTVISPEPLKAGPDIGLDVLDQVAEVDRPICIGQSRRNEESAHRALDC